MADQPHAEVPRQPEEGHDGHDNRSVASEISEGQADTAAELTTSFPDGYPAFSELLGSSAGLQNFRRIRTLRMRILLYKQDKVTQLEQRLNQIDRDEEIPVFLGCRRRDANKEREKVFMDLDIALGIYDRLLQRSQWAINIPSPTNEACQTVANWLDNGSINRDERASINRGPLALLNIGYVKDASMVKITTAIEPLVKWYFKRKQKSDQGNDEGGSDVVRIPNPLIRAIARTLAAIFTIAVLLVPVILLNLAQTTAVRFTIIFIATALFITAVTAIRKATMSEMFVAGATYAAVLVVFVGSNGPGGVSSSTGN